MVAMRDVDINFTTHFITHASTGITAVEDLKGKRGRLGESRIDAGRVITALFLATARARSRA